MQNGHIKCYQFDFYYAFYHPYTVPAWGQHRIEFCGDGDVERLISTANVIAFYCNTNLILFSAPTKLNKIFQPPVLSVKRISVRPQCHCDANGAHARFLTAILPEPYPAHSNSIFIINLILSLQLVMQQKEKNEGHCQRRSDKCPWLRRTERMRDGNRAIERCIIWIYSSSGTFRPRDSINYQCVIRLCDDLETANASNAFDAIFACFRRVSYFRSED